MNEAAAQHSRIDADWESCRLIDAAQCNSVRLASRHRSWRNPSPSSPATSSNFFAIWRATTKRRGWTQIVSVIRSVWCGHSADCWRKRLRRCSHWIRGFDTAARRGRNFSRINRDIRFAKDKTPYRTQMYLKFCGPISGRWRNRRTVCGCFGKERYGWIPDLLGIEIQGIGAGADRSSALHAGARLVGAAEEAAEPALRELLVLGRKGGMEAAIGLAGFGGRLEENAGVGCPAQADRRRLRRGRRSPANLARFFATCIRFCDLRVCRIERQAGTQFVESEIHQWGCPSFSQGSQRCPPECSRDLHIGIEGG